MHACMHAAAVLRLREELDDTQARVEAALNDLEESQACALDKAREEASLRREGEELLGQLEELEGDLVVHVRLGLLVV